jgi:hypothetical protein
MAKQATAFAVPSPPASRMRKFMTSSPLTAGIVGSRGIVDEIWMPCSIGLEASKECPNSRGHSQPKAGRPRGRPSPDTRTPVIRSLS